MTTKLRRALLVFLLVTSVLCARAVGIVRDGRTCQGIPATIVADEGFVRGTDGDDVIVATKRNGNVEAGRGGDLICLGRGAFHEAYGQGGADRIVGGPAQDNIYPGAGNDLVRSGRGQDLITDDERRGDDVYRGGPGLDEIRFSVMFARGRSGAIVADLKSGRVSGHGRDRISGFGIVEGTAGHDTILGDGEANLLIGVRGGDTIRGRGGDDVIDGARALVGEGSGPPGPAEGADRLLSGGAGDDRISGNAGADRIAGGPGNDTLDGGGPNGPQLPRGDAGDGGPGRDVCRSFERDRRCER